MFSNNSYLSEINDSSDEVKKEFLTVVNKSLATFFENIKQALIANNFEQIVRLSHKIQPTLIMLELSKLQMILTAIKSNQENLPKDVDFWLETLETERQNIAKAGWL